jgi:uncharacterized membrane protein
MNHAMSLLLCLTGFAALACAMERQQDELFGGPLSRTATRALRGVGACALAAALAATLAHHGWGLGLVMYSGHTSLAAGMVYGVLIIRMRWRSSN